MQQSDTEGEPYTHEKVLDVIRDKNRECPSNGVHQLSEYPVGMQQENGGERQGKPANFQHGISTIGPANNHSRKNESAPGAAEGDKENADFVPFGRTRGKVVDGHIIARRHLVR